jgi:hypothetical protein
LWSINFSCSLFYCWRNVKADVTCCFFVHALAFWAPILHILHCSAGCLQQFHRVMYVQFVENMLITLECEPKIITNFVVDFFNKVIIHDGWVASFIFIMHGPSLNCLTHCRTFHSLITLGP